MMPPGTWRVVHCATCRHLHPLVWDGRASVDGDYVYVCGVDGQHGYRGERTELVVYDHLPVDVE